MYAAHFGCEDVVKALLSRKDVDITLRCKVRSRQQYWAVFTLIYRFNATKFLILLNYLERENCP